MDMDTKPGLSRLRKTGKLEVYKMPAVKIPCVENLLNERVLARAIKSRKLWRHPILKSENGSTRDEA